jgi:regulator of sigma E protease
MSVFLAIIAFILILGLLIFVHELGHFITAKRAGVLVEEFGIGFPPRLFAIKRGETTYSLNLIPLGGFTKMKGEEDPSHPRSLASKSIGTRFLVLSAGSFMNALLPIFLFALAFMIPSQVTAGDVVVQSVAEGSPAATAGIVEGDTILAVDGHAVRNLSDVAYYTHLNLGENIPIELERETVWLTPRWNPPQGQGAIGVEMEWPMPNAHAITESYPPWEAGPRGARTTWESIILLKNEVVSWFHGNSPQVAGPVGIFQITEEVTGAGIDPLLRLAAFISINLAIINLLPIPGLDGGRLAFVTLEWIRRGKRISPQKEQLAHIIGFMLLITLVIVVSYFDISRLMGGGGIP